MSWDARYNFRVGRIENAVPGSWVYLHEEGHQRLLSMKPFRVIHRLMDGSELLLAYLGICLLALDFPSWALQIAASVLAYYAFLEGEAWIYALIRHFSLGKTTKQAR